MLCVKAKRDQPAMLNVNLKRRRLVQQSRLLSATAAAHDLLLSAADRCLSKDLSLLSTALSSPPTFPIITSFPPGFPCIPHQCSAYYEPTSSSMTQLCHIDFMYSSLLAFLNHLYLNTIFIPLDRHNPHQERVGPSVLV